MVRILLTRWLPILLLVLGLTPDSLVIAGAGEPVLVLTAFGTTTAAFDTYRHIEVKVKERFPGHEIRWAFTSGKVRRKVAQEQGKELKNLPQTLKELKAAGFSRVVVQSLHVVPGEEWQEVVAESRKIPGLKVALGQPLLSDEADAARTLKALGKIFPSDLKKTAVVLVGHGSPNPRAQQTYRNFEKLLRSRYPGQNVYLGLVSGKPGRDEVLAQVKRGGASSVFLVPFLLVAGEHVNTDIQGAGPESWRSRLLAQGSQRVELLCGGLGYNGDIINIYLEHLQEALRSLTD
jgi:sirohydrochlorin cobaltochelatase